MSNYGLTKEGFKRKPFSVILEDMQGRARSLFGEDINLSEKSPLGLFIQLVSFEQSILWEEAEKVYYAPYIDDAEGRQLDGSAKYTAITRKGQQRAIGSILVEGDEGTLITPNNLIIGTKTGINFIPSETKTIGIEPTEIKIICVEAGEQGNVPANSITEILTPLFGLKSVINTEPIKDGSDIESDLDFRERYYRSLSKPGGSSIPAVEGALLNLPTVKDAFVEENDTLLEVNGLPPKSIAPYILGGNDEEIATTILDKKSGGIQSFGSINIQIIDEKGKMHTIGFTRATSKEVYVKVSIVKNNMYPFNGDSLIKNAIIEHIGGLDSNGVEHRGLRFGQSVVTNKLIGIANIDGIDDISIELSLDGVNYSSSNIKIEKAEKAITDESKVVIV